MKICDEHVFGDNGAKLIEIRKDGTEILRAIYSATDKKFVSVGEEEYGMLYDDKFYEKAVNEFEESFQKVFFEKMLLREKVCSFGHMGYFKLHYVYIPMNYTIVVENELRTFTIAIEDEEKERNSLYRIERFDNQLSKSNIKNAIKLLKKVLDTDEIDFYIHIDGKLYRKRNNVLKRVKDIRELM